jgi:hypothetical protein
MKKIFLITAVVSAFSFASCKKSQTCTCTAVDSSVSPPVSASSSTTLDSTEKKNKTACEDGSSTSGTIVTTCVIK